jgi:hypothetical protein
VTGYTEGGLDGNTNSGNRDLILVKYYDNGTKQWTQQLGTSSNDVGYGVTVDSSDNLYVTGYTAGGLDGNTNSGGNDLFLVKYNSSGTKQWTQQLGSSSGDIGYGVTVDSSDNIYVTGYTFGGLDGNTSSGSDDLFLVKYNSSGIRYVKQSGSVKISKNKYDSQAYIELNASDNLGIISYCVQTGSSTPSSADACEWNSVVKIQTLNINSIPITSNDRARATSYVYVWFKDSLGNISDMYTDSVYCGITANCQ